MQSFWHQKQCLQSFLIKRWWKSTLHPSSLGLLTLNGDKPESRRSKLIKVNTDKNDFISLQFLVHLALLVLRLLRLHFPLHWIDQVPILVCKIKKRQRSKWAIPFNIHTGGWTNFFGSKNFLGNVQPLKKLQNLHNPPGKNILVTLRQLTSNSR